MLTISLSMIKLFFVFLLLAMPLTFVTFKVLRINTCVYILTHIYIFNEMSMCIYWQFYSHVYIWCEKRFVHSEKKKLLTYSV